jgi:hypothetical protein
MSATLLYAFLFALGVIFFGLAAFFFAWHIPLPTWLRPSYVQEAFEKLPAWRRRFIYVYPRVSMIVTTILALAFAGFAAYFAYATTGAAGAYQATSEDIAIVEDFAVALIVCQAFFLAMLFLQLWRSRRGLRKLALRSGLNPQS